MELLARSATRSLALMPRACRKAAIRRTSSRSSPKLSVRPSSTETIYGLSGWRAAARSIQLRSKLGPASVSGKRFLSQLPRHRQRRHELPAIALLPELGRKLLGNMPGEDDCAIGLVSEQPRLVHNRN